MGHWDHALFPCQGSVSVSGIARELRHEDGNIDDRRSAFALSIAAMFSLVMVWDAMSALMRRIVRPLIQAKTL